MDSIELNYKIFNYKVLLLKKIIRLIIYNIIDIFRNFTSTVRTKLF